MKAPLSRTMTRALRTACAAGAVLLLGGLALAGWLRDDSVADTAMDLECSDYRFEPGAWRRAYRAGGNDEPTDAQRIADAVVKCRVLRRLSRDRVVGLLGRPDNYVVAGNELSWNIGPERGAFSIDSEHLLVRFGSDSRVRSVAITTD